MNSRCFGTSGLSTSVIGFGTWPIGGARYGKSDDTEAIRAIQVALDFGVTCFDTAPSYGNGHAEEVLGKALGSRRPDALIATKGGMTWDDQSFVLGQDSSREHLVKGLDDSLRRLKTDYVDLFLIHWPDGVTPLDQVAANLEYLVESGKTRVVGVCNFTGDQLRQICGAIGSTSLVASQVGFSLFDRRWANETFATCPALGIGVMAYGPLAHGLLTGAINSQTTFDELDWRAAGVIFGQPLLTPENRDRNFAVIDQLRDFASGKGATVAQLAISWVLAHDAVTVALTGARNEMEIAEAATAARLNLTTNDMREIETIMTGAVGMITSLPAGGTSRATRQQGA